MLKKHSCTNAEKKIEEAFTLQIIPFYADIYRYFLHLGAESTLAEDMAQDVMVTAWKNRKKLLEINYQKAWLLRVAHNQYISFRRLAEQKYQYTTSDLDIQKPEDRRIEQDILDLLVTQESIQCLHISLQTLSPKYSEPIRLRYFGELSHKEIAELLRINPNTVRSIISRGLQRLKQIMEELDHLKGEKNL